MAGKKSEKELKIWTVPTVLNVSRVLLTFVVIYMIINNEYIWATVSVFAVAAITDFFDGRIARKYHLVNKFGARADMVADRFLWVGTALAIIFTMGVEGRLSYFQGIELFAIMSREIITAPFAITALFSGHAFPSARYVAKVTTFMQGFAIPALLLSIYYPVWAALSVPLSVAIFVTGIISAKYYIADIQEEK